MVSVEGRLDPARAGVSMIDLLFSRRIEDMSCPEKRIGQ